LPFADLGFVIVDEEHEQTFKQIDPAPRYHARDAAVVLASFYKAKVLLGSATPVLKPILTVSLEIWFSRNQGAVRNVMTDIKLVDLKDKYFEKMKGHFSDTLIEEITSAIALGEQVILFQNRRGYFL
jgi:primosomal protein N' (replication factor Y)